MTKLYLITYDLKKPGQNYSELYEAIKSLGDWQHPLESSWLVRVNDKIRAQDIYNRLRPKIDDNDRIFITEIPSENNRQGWLSKTFWTWLNNN